MVISVPTPGGVGKAADPDLPVDALSAALLCADVWIEFNHQWLLHFMHCFLLLLQPMHPNHHLL